MRSSPSSSRCGVVKVALARFDGCVGDGIVAIGRAGRVGEVTSMMLDGEDVTMGIALGDVKEYGDDLTIPRLLIPVPDLRTGEGVDGEGGAFAL